MIMALAKKDELEHRDTFDQMFRGRAAVFHQRLHWKVIVQGGMERDRHDEGNEVIYIIAREEERVVGSLRLLPMTGETMLRNEFSSFFPGCMVNVGGNAWECSRFCVHWRPGDQSAAAARRVSSELLIGLCEHAMLCGVDRIIGLYDARMTRVYHRIGWTPRPLALSAARDLVLGDWHVSSVALAAMRQRLGLASPTLRSAA
jgi:acyl homoserine lactone synthase